MLRLGKILMVSSSFLAISILVLHISFRVDDTGLAGGSEGTLYQAGHRATERLEKSRDSSEFLSALAKAVTLPRYEPKDSLERSRRRKLAQTNSEAVGSDPLNKVPTLFMPESEDYAEIMRSQGQLIANLLQQRSIELVRRDGEVIGLKLPHYLAEMNMLQKAGFSEGDILKSIDQIPIQSGEELLIVIDALQERGYFSASIERDGQDHEVVVGLEALLR